MKFKGIISLVMALSVFVHSHFFGTPITRWCPPKPPEPRPEIPESNERFTEDTPEFVVVASLRENIKPGCEDSWILGGR